MKDTHVMTVQTPKLDLWIQRITAATLVALACGLLMVGINFYVR
jgi:hypothetical protein